MTLIRGGQIRFIVVPEMLMHAPYFDRIKAWRKYKGNPIVGGTGDQARGRTAKVYERARQKSQKEMGVGDKRSRHGGRPPPGQMSMGMPPPGMMAPRGMMPQGMPRGMPMMPPPHMMPGMPPQGMPPKGMPPQGMPPQGMPPHPYGPPKGGLPPSGEQGFHGPYGLPRGPPPT